MNLLNEHDGKNGTNGAEGTQMAGESETSSSLRLSPALGEAREGAAVTAARRRVGRIARLPHKVREMVNQRILDGVAYDEIVAELEKLGFDGVSKSMVCRWVKGGYEEWLLRRERRTERLQRSKEMAAEVARMRGRNAFTQMNHFVVAEQLNDVLERLDAEFLLAKARKDPALFFRLVRAVNAQFLNEVFATKVEVEVKKFRAMEREKKRARRPKVPGGATREKIAEINSRLGIM